MPEPALVSYERVPNSLIGNTSADFVLPAQKLSVTTFAGFKLVSFPALTNKETLNGQLIQLVGTSEPDTELQNETLRSLIPPPIAVLQRFLQRGVEGTIPDAPSISHEGRHLPVDVLDVWTVFAATHRIRSRWDKGFKWLRKQERKNGMLYDRVVSLLQNISWGGTVRGFDADSCPISMLATYLSDDWLTDEHMSQYTELLQRRVFSSVQHAAETCVTGPWFSTHLSNFVEKPDHAYLERIGQDLASGRRKRVIGMRNVGGNHWIAFAVDSTTASIAIGDSFKKSHPSFVSAVSGWVKRHMGKTYQEKTLSCTKQDDWFSCGILAMNTIEHYLDPERYPLVSKTPHALAAARMERAIDVMTHHLDSVSCSLILTATWCLLLLYVDSI